MVGRRSEEAGDDDDEVDYCDAGHAQRFAWSAVLAHAFSAPGPLVVLTASLYAHSPRLYSVLGQPQVAG